MLCINYTGGNNNIKHLINIFLFLALVLTVSDVSYGANYKYITVTVGEVYSIEIPSTWKQQPQDNNDTLQNFTDNKLKSINVKQPPAQNHILFAANAFDKNGESLASARMSVRGADDLSQAAAQQLTNAEVQQIGLSNKNALENGLTNLNIKTRYIGTTKQTINGKVCIVTETEMITPEGKLLRQITDTYFLGDKALKVTVAYNPNNSKTYRPIIDRIRNSVVVK